VGTDHNIYSADLTFSNPQVTQLTTDAFWDNVAMSKDGWRLAAISRYVDTSIYIYDFVSQQPWGRFYLYNPTYAQGVDMGGVLYADALEWDYSGDYLMYDAYSVIPKFNGPDLDYWDVGFLKAWSSSASTFGDGAIGKLFSGLAEGISIGNPTFAKNSPYIIAFDYVDQNTNTIHVLGANIETGDVGTIGSNNPVLGFPSYSKTDNQLVFSGHDNSSQEVIALISINSDKISSSTTAQAFIGAAKWPVWYAQGQRNYSAVENQPVAETAIEMHLYPNPVNDRLFLDLKVTASGPAIIEIMDMVGKKIHTRSLTHLQPGSHTASISTHSLPAGIYIVNVEMNKAAGSARFIKH